MTTEPDNRGREDWHEHALCAQTGPDDHTWFPPDNVNVTAAKAICAVCPVKALCLAEALLNREQHGVFGGKSVKERRAMSNRTPKTEALHGSTRMYHRERKAGGPVCDLCREAANVHDRERKAAKAVRVS